jgi:hypothetical protein
MRKICREEKCNNYVWGSGYCICHQPKKPLKRSPLPKIGKSIYKAKEEETFEETLTKAINTISERNLFFLSIWQQRPHKSEISGEWLSQDLDGLPSSSAYFHHIIPKSKLKEAEYDPDNIILLTINEHSNVEMDVYRYEEISKRREQLKIKYKL